MPLTTVIAAGGAIEAALFHQAGPDPFSHSAERDAQAEQVAGVLAAFIDGASTSLDIAIYDFRLKDKPRELITAALQGRVAAGVAIRIVYDAAPVNDRDADGAGNDPAPSGTASFLVELGLPIEAKGVTGQQRRRYSKNALMHNKYIVRDATSPDAAVLTGSTNFTNDAFGLQENNIVTLRSRDIASYYTLDFNDLWDNGEILPSSGAGDTANISVGGVPVTVEFSPGEGQSIIREIVSMIDAAAERISIGSMLITSGPVLAALSEALDRGVVLEGICDGTQMESSIAQIQESGQGEDRVVAWEKIKANLTLKKTVKYAPNSPHDFMHLKTLVADDALITGSFNFSNSARGNAENILAIRDHTLAGGYRSFIQSLITLYRV